mgnify:CR=1 FL=1
MATNTGKKARKQQQETRGYATSLKEYHPLNTIQQLYLESIQENTITFGKGSAGTGKTFIAAAYAAKELFYKNVDKVILTRPNVEVGRGLGFLPGELDEKYLPYLAPFESVFVKCLGRGFYDYALEKRVIEPMPIGFLRGATFENAIVLIDEAQNMTKTELKMLLSRIGRNCKVVLSGDPDQADIRDSGFVDAIERLRNIPGVGVISFEDGDIVRSKMCKEIILAYKN